MRRLLETRALQAVGLLFLALLLAAPAYRNLGLYSNFYDGGVYLESARMLAAGHAPYRAIFRRHRARRAELGSDHYPLRAHSFRFYGP